MNNIENISFPAKDVSILLIEENKEDVRIISEYLKKSTKINASLKIVDRIKKAKTILFYEKFDIVLVDLKVEGITPEELFDTLGKNKINIQVITTSEIKISILINEEHTDLAVQKLHKAFKLHK